MRASAAGPLLFAVLMPMSAACGGTAAPPVRNHHVPTASPVPTTSPTRATPAGQALAGKVVTIDPGHNGGNASHPKEINKQVDIITGRKPCNTTGTETAAGYTEHAFTWDVAVKLRPILEKMGAKVVLTRPNDTGVGPCIDRRAAIGNDAKSDAVLSIHADGAQPDGHGFHVILPGLVQGHNDAIVTPSRALGVAVRNAYRQGTGLSYSTYRGRNALETRTDLGGLNLSTRPAIFIECGNMNNTGDAAKMSSPAFRERIAASLAAGLRKYLTGG
ncbi:N-acetylmuramoyl-L-alanine amidase [Nonomuraea sp. NN258]|uniref:N-acetylmuramoyl-L-alanine amidase n=1 Tax=Nonomuraea antri TaxID=2730852 RepID=UPI0015696AD3|nr:N-acetylmuramoyl-L-alanine amidase [Nonomuraea antri]NRQ33049.1 N-acetylmuramoyl-L-alanine amidase [Nonomuraea antri]